MAEQTAQEPTMEEILASIRRIISEDDPAPAAAPKAAEPREEVLELTDRVEEPVRQAAQSDSEEIEYAPAPASPIDPEPMASDSLSALSSFSLPEPEPAPAKPAARPAPDMSQDRDSLISGSTAASVSSAFSQLSLSRNTPMPEAGRGLEDVVRDLLRPLLKEWLDQNLPAIVERSVRAEVERLSRGV